jgi:hypothetical protein
MNIRAGDKDGKQDVEVVVVVVSTLFPQLQRSVQCGEHGTPKRMPGLRQARSDSHSGNDSGQTGRPGLFFGGTQQNAALGATEAKIEGGVVAKLRSQLR